MKMMNGSIGGYARTKAQHRGGWQALLVCLFAVIAVAAQAMEPLSDDELSKQSGAGIALALQDIDFMMAPTSYIEATPSTSNLPAGYYGADLRWYGLSMTGDNLNSYTSGDTQWNGGCTAVTFASGNKSLCALGTTTGSGIHDLASSYNPFVLRVFNYAGYNAAGTLLTQGSTGTAPTVLEFRGPTASDSWRWAFWGSLIVNATTSGPQPIGAVPTQGTTCPNTTAGTTGANTLCGLQSQTIIDGKPIAMVAGKATPTTVQLFTIPAVSDNVSASDTTLGIVYQSALSGNFHFGVEQAGTGTTSLIQPPTFDQQEGMYFMNVNAFLPLGHLNDQALTFSQNGTSGNFVIELTRVPSAANSYSDIYCGSTSCTLDAHGAIASPNPATHGNVDWGTTATGGAAGTNYNDIAGTNTTQGIFFDDPTAAGSTTGTTVGTITNIGTAHMSNILIQHMMITTCGAGSTATC